MLRKQKILSDFCMKIESSRSEPFVYAFSGEHF